MSTDIKIKELIFILILIISFQLVNVRPLVVNAAVYNISSSVEKYRIKLQTEKYLTDQSEHFIYKYTENDKNSISYIKENAEKSYNELSEIFDYNFKTKLIIIIFPSTDEMNNVLKLPNEQKSIGLYYSGFISVLSPGEWVNNKNFKVQKTVFEQNGIILHELVHFFVDIKTNGNYPQWFTEGVALFFEKELIGNEWGKGQVYNIKPYKVEELTQKFNELNIDYAYRRSYEIISSYLNNRDVIELMNILDKLGEGYALDELGI